MSTHQGSTLGRTLPSGHRAWLRITAITPTAITAEVSKAASNDIELRCDRFGCPELPGRRIKAMLVDAWETMAAAHSDDATVAGDLFGRSLGDGGKLTIFRARIAPPVAKQVERAVTRRNNPLAAHLVKDAFSVERTRTRRDRTLGGAPAAGTLRTARLLRDGVTLWAPLLVPDQINTEHHWWLLARLCKAVQATHLGRNRGWGQVRYSLCWVADDPFHPTRTNPASAEKAKWRPMDVTDFLHGAGSQSRPASAQAAGAVGDDRGSGSPTGSQPSGSNHTGVSESSTSTTWFVPYTVELTAPAILTAATGDPNRASTERFVPGSALRGAAAARLLGDPLFDEIVLSGRVRFLPALPSTGHHDSIPVPACWALEKPVPQHPLPLVNLPEEVPVFGAPANDVDHDDEEHDDWMDEMRPVDLDELEPVPHQFVSLADCTYWADPVTETNFHLQRDPRDWRKGRAWEEGGDVFAYEALAAGTTLSGAIAITAPDTQQLEQCRAKLEQIFAGSLLRLGRSSAADYGGWARVDFREPQERQLANNSVVELVDSDLEQGSRFFVLCTSDVAARDPSTGQHRAGALIDLVLAALHEKVTCQGTWIQTRTVSGYNTTWRTALPQIEVAAAGSVLVLEATQQITREDLVAIEQRGLGERRADGFGGIVFCATLGNPPLVSDFEPFNGGPVPAPMIEQMVVDRYGNPKRARDESDPWIQLQTQLWSTLMRSFASQAADEIVESATRLPSATLCHRIRRIHQASVETAKTGSGTPAQQHFDQQLEALAQPAKDALNKCKLGSTTLLLWLGDGQKRFETAASVWEGSLRDRLDSLFNATALDHAAHYQQLRERLAAEADSMLVSDVLTGLARKAQQERHR